VQSIRDLLEYVPVDSLVPHPENPNRGDVQAIKESLAENGRFLPIVVQASTRHVLSGNHTLQAARELGHTHIDAVVMDVDDHQARKILLAANRTAQRGRTDLDALAEVLSQLDGDYLGTAYSDADVERLLAPPPTLDELQDTYRNPDGPDPDAPADDGDAPGGEFWPVLKFRVPPEVRDDFYALTILCPNPNDDAERFRYLLNRARRAHPSE
jgi:hypothetical protein